LYPHIGHSLCSHNMSFVLAHENQIFYLFIYRDAAMDEYNKIVILIEYDFMYCIIFCNLG